MFLILKKIVTQKSGDQVLRLLFKPLPFFFYHPWTPFNIGVGIMCLSFLFYMIPFALNKCTEYI